MKKVHWHISVDVPQELLMALYVRDAAALHPASMPNLPALSPAVDRRPVAQAVVAAASAQWVTWWNLLIASPRQPAAGEGEALAGLPELADPPELAGLPGLAELPELAGLVAACRDDARRYVMARKRDMARRHAGPPRETAIINGVRRRHRRAPLRLELLELPLAGAGSWPLGQGRYVVSAMLRADEGAYRRWLTGLVTSAT